MKRSGNRMLRLILSVAAAAVLITCMTVASFAAEANENVNNARNGVVQIRTYFNGNDGTEYELLWGSGFLINDMTVMTCDHVVHPVPSTIEDIRNNEVLGPMVAGKSDSQIMEKLSYKVTIYSDSSVAATVVEGAGSANGDYAVLKLNSPLSDYTPLHIRNTADNPVNATEACYVLGFPYKMVLFKIDKSLQFSKSAVEVTPGTVKKVDLVEGVMTIIMSDTVTSGYSGGPMVDADGSVIGIAYAKDEVDDNQSYATASQEFLPVLTTLGIDFTPADGSTVDDGKKTGENTGTESEKTDDVPKPQQQTTEKTEKKSMLPFIIGGAVALLAIIVAAVLLLTRKKKGDAPAPAGTYTAAPPTPAVPPTGTGAPVASAPKVPPAYTPRPDTGVLNQGSNETTVLGQGAAETTVLSENQVSGSLTRTKTGEKINITRDNFKIGRERSKVDYCISDNTAIGRHHATIVNRNGEAYLVDQNSRNFTFLNDVKVQPNTETKLKNGDKITFGDENFTYNA